MKMLEVSLQIFRCKESEPPHYDTFTVQVAETAHVIDAIDAVKVKIAMLAWAHRQRVALITCGGAGGQPAIGSTQRATTAMANLAEGIQGLVQHMRSEQQVVRSWVETQAEQQREMQVLLETIAKALQAPVGE